MTLAGHLEWDSSAMAPGPGDSLPFGLETRKNELNSTEPSEFIFPGAFVLGRSY